MDLFVRNEGDTGVWCLVLRAASCEVVAETREMATLEDGGASILEPDGPKRMVIEGEMLNGTSGRLILDAARGGTGGRFAIGHGTPCVELNGWTPLGVGMYAEGRARVEMMALQVMPAEPLDG